MIGVVAGQSAGCEQLQIALETLGHFAAFDNLLAVTMRASNRDQCHGHSYLRDAITIRPSVLSTSVHLHFCNTTNMISCSSLYYLNNVRLLLLHAIYTFSEARSLLELRALGSLYALE